MRTATQNASMSKGDGFDWHHIFGVATNRYKGYRNAVHPSTLGFGEAYDAKNLRCGPDGVIKKRDGVSSAVAAATGLATPGTFKGCSDFYDDGTYVHIFIAWKEADNDVHVYHRKYTKSSTTWGNWAQLTEDSGKFGDTALTEPNNGRVQFYFVEIPGQSQTLTDNYHTFKDSTVCVISGGTNTRSVDLKVVIDGAVTGNSDTGLSHCNAIPPPVAISLVWDAYDWLDVKGGAVTVTGNASAEWGTVQKTGGFWQFISDASVSGGGAATIVFDSEDAIYGLYTSDTDHFQCRQIWLLAHANIAHFWSNVTIAYNRKIGSGAYAYKTIDAAPTVLPTNIADYELVVLDLPEELPEAADTLTVNGIKLTTTAGTPVSCTVNIYAFGVSGVVPSGTRYGICRRNRTGHIDSPGTVFCLSNLGLTKAEARLANEGVNGAVDADQLLAAPNSTMFIYSTLPNGLILPMDSRMFGTYRLKYSNPHTGELSSNAADTVVFFRQEPADTDYYRLDRVATATYTSGSGWAFDSGTASSSLTYTDTVPPAYRDFSDVLPDESCEPPGAFRCGISVGGRAWIGRDFAAGAKVYASEFGSPMRFTGSIAQSADQRGAASKRIAGEKCVGFGQTVAEGLVNSVHVFTDKGVYRIVRSTDGLVMFDLLRESHLGCCSAQSIAQLDSTLCYVDKDREFRFLGSESLSRDRITNLDNVPDAYSNVIDVEFFKGRAYIARVPSGGTENTEVDVFNFRGGYWESRDTFTSTVEPEQWLKWNVDGAVKLYYVGADGAIYQYEASGQHTDNGQAIAFLIESREYSNSPSPMWKKVFARHMGFVGTDVSSGTITTTRVFTSPASTSAGTINIDVSTAYAWRQDARSSGSGSPGGEGNGVRLRWSGSLSAAMECYALTGELKDAPLGGND